MRNRWYPLALFAGLGLALTATGHAQQGTDPPAQPAQEKKADVLTAKKVHLKLRDVPVIDAVDELARQSGFNLQIQGTVADVAKRTVTLDTGETTFWDAFDQLCRQAGLAEQASPWRSADFTLPPPDPFGPFGKGKGKKGGGGKGGRGDIIDPAEQEKLWRQQSKGQDHVDISQRKATDSIRLFAEKNNIKDDKLPKDLYFKFLEQRDKWDNDMAALGRGDPFGGIGGGFAKGGKKGGGKKGGKGGGPPIPIPDMEQRQIHIADGKSNALPTVYAGSVRLRLVPQRRQDDEVTYAVEVTPEPGVLSFAPGGASRLDQSYGTKGESLKSSLVIDAPFYGVPQILLEVKLADAKGIAELRGEITGQVLAAGEPLITVDNVFDSGGKTFKGNWGGAIEVIAVEKIGDPEVQVKIRLETPAAFGGDLRAFGLPMLTDAKGEPYQLVEVPSHAARRAGNQSITRDMTLVFHANPGQGDAARLVFNSLRPVTVQMPFRFTNVPLPPLQTATGGNAPPAVPAPEANSSGSSANMNIRWPAVASFGILGLISVLLIVTGQKFARRLVACSRSAS